MRGAASEIDGIIDGLVSAGVLAPDNRLRAEQAALATGERIDAVLVKLGFASEDVIADAFASALGLRRASPGDVDPFIAKGIDVAFLRHARCVPARRPSGQIVLVAADPFDPYPSRALGGRIGSVDVEVATARDIDRLIDGLINPSRNVGGDVVEAAAADVAVLAEFSTDAPVIRYVSGLIEKAVDCGASDIHLSIGRGVPQVKLRRDGVLVAAEAPPPNLFLAIVARIKILASLDISEQRRPQDGRFRTVVGGREIDLRVSILPVLDGESSVLRILDRSRAPDGVDDLGLGAADRDAVLALLKSAHGLILVTGPTGSGKTTTIASMLAEVTGPERHVISVEDPVEIRVAGVTQIQVVPAIGLTFPIVLRSVLRHDPDIISVGEIRDKETAQIAVHAALTGHLVLATLHTNSAAAAVARLVDMGIEAFLLAATLRGLLAQRLLRKRCDVCDGTNSCSRCGGTGYRGRFAIIERITIDDELAGLIGQGSSAQAIERSARAGGFRPLVEIGRLSVARGETTEAELQRVLGEG